jgi:hypothetical protein
MHQVVGCMQADKTDGTASIAGSSPAPGTHRLTTNYTPMKTHEPLSKRGLTNAALIELQKHNKVTVGNAALGLFETLVKTYGYKDNAVETEIDCWVGIALALAHKHQWHPIVTCPHNELVLLWTEHESYRATIGKYCSHKGGWRNIEWASDDEHSPTHWMPLPMGPNPAAL